VGFHNLVAVSDLQRHGWGGGRHAARSYSWISPPRTLRRRILAVVRSAELAALVDEIGRRALVASSLVSRCGAAPEHSTQCLDERLRFSDGWEVPAAAGGRYGLARVLPLAW
jgi:hypothetical protein